MADSRDAATIRNVDIQLQNKEAEYEKVNNKVNQNNRNQH